MITKVMGNGMKGLTFEETLERLTLFIGPNGAGKSARSQALQLAVMGYVIGAAKKNADILNDFGVGDKLDVTIQIDGKGSFLRGFVRNEKTGSVSQRFGVNMKKATEEAFNRELGKAGRPVVIDVTTFTGLSDQKMIDVICDLYPPEQDLSKLIADIEKTKLRVNGLMEKAKTAEGLGAKLAQARAEIKLPAGTLAEITALISHTEQALHTANASVKEIETKEATDAAAKKAEEETRRKIEEEQRRKAAETPKVEEKPKTDPGSGATATGVLPGVAPKVEGRQITTIAEADAELAKKGLQVVIEAINTAGCLQCTARLVAIRELRKIKEAVHAR